MQSAGGGIVLIAIGLFLLYLAITGKLDCFVGAFRCTFSTAQGADTKTISGSGTTKTTPVQTIAGIKIPPLPSLNTIGVGV